MSNENSVSCLYGNVHILTNTHMSVHVMHNMKEIKAKVPVSLL